MSTLLQGTRRFVKFDYKAVLVPSFLSAAQFGNYLIWI